MHGIVKKQFTYPSSETITINVIYLIAELYLAPRDASSSGFIQALYLTICIFHKNSHRSMRLRNCHANYLFMSGYVRNIKFTA